MKGLFQRNLKNPVQFGEEHGAFGVVFEESKNEIQKTSMPEKQCLYHRVNGDGELWILEILSTKERRLCLISCRRTLGLLSSKETLWKLKRKRWSQKTSGQINSKSVHVLQDFEKLALRTLERQR